MGPPTPLVLDAVTRRYGATWALRGVDLEIGPGESLALLGENGAGKSTLVALACGLRAPTSGHVRLFGRPPAHASARSRLGVTPQANALPAMARVSELLDLVAAHHAEPLTRDEVITSFGLDALADTLCGALSGGQRRRVMLALAVMGRPELLVLDEPTVGLDAASREELWRLLTRYRERGGALLLTSHHIEEAERLCESAVVLRGGRVVERAPLTELRRRHGVSTVSFHTSDADHALARLDAVTGVAPGRAAARPGRRAVTLHTADADATVRSLVASGLEFDHLHIARADIADVVARLSAESTP